MMPDAPYYQGLYEWFDAHWAAKVTPEFAAWWLTCYGLPDAYDDKHEYARRMAFALMGWLAAKETG